MRIVLAIALLTCKATAKTSQLTNMADEEENKASKYHIKYILLAPAYGNLEKPFTGQVEKLMKIHWLKLRKMIQLTNPLLTK